MKSKSRVINSVFNFITSIGGQLLTIVLQFVVRTVFINTLGKSYLGINGLFSNVLQMLSLAEFGVGSAILFKLYDPIAKKDEKRIAILLKFYKNVYSAIGIIIVVLGLSLIPFLRYIVNDYDKLQLLGINAVFIYILFLLKSVVSYFYDAYLSSIVKADQKEYILNIVSYAVSILSSIMQVVLLVSFKSIELYVLVQVIINILQNLINAKISEKLYPFINKKYKEKITKEEMFDIFKDCGALFLYKINNVVLKATDNIVISAFLGIEAVGMYSNYYIFYSTIDSFFNKLFESIKHSLGNLHTANNPEHEYIIFKTVNLIAVILGATASIGLACVSNEFIISWIGKDWIIEQPFSILMGIELFGLALRQFLGKYRSAMGLFQQAKYRPVFGIIINLICSILFVNCFGISGVLLGTIVADWTTILWYDPLVIHKYGFYGRFSIIKYYIKNLFNILICLLVGCLCYYFSSNICYGMGWLSIVIHIAVIGIFVPLIFLLLYIKTDEIREIKSIVYRILKIKKKNDLERV